MIRKNRIYSYKVLVATTCFGLAMTPEEGLAVITSPGSYDNKGTMAEAKPNVAMGLSKFCMKTINLNDHKKHVKRPVNRLEVKTVNPGISLHNESSYDVGHEPKSATTLSSYEIIPDEPKSATFSSYSYVDTPDNKTGTDVSYEFFEGSESGSLEYEEPIIDYDCISDSKGTSENYSNNDSLPDVSELEHTKSSIFDYHEVYQTEVNPGNETFEHDNPLWKDRGRGKYDSPEHTKITQSQETVPGGRGESGEWQELSFPEDFRKEKLPRHGRELKGQQQNLSYNGHNTSKVTLHCTKSDESLIKTELSQDDKGDYLLCIDDREIGLNNKEKLSLVSRGNISVSDIIITFRENVSNKNAFRKLRLSKEGNEDKVDLTPEIRIAEQLRADIVITGEKTLIVDDSIEDFERASINSPVAKAATEIGLIDNSKVRTNAAARLLTPLTGTVQGVQHSAVSGAKSTIATRINSLVLPSPLPVAVVASGVENNDSLLIGVAAGDEPSKYGLWFSPVYSNGLQKRMQYGAGYKAKTYGGTVGFDTKVNDSALIGTAVSLMNTDVRHQDFKSGDSTKIDIILFSIYSLFQVNDKWFVQGVVNAGSSKINNKEHRLNSSTTNEIARAEYRSASFAGDMLVGYNKVVSNKFVITPIGGVSYSLINDRSYSETGTTNQNLDVEKKANHRLEAVAGLRVSNIPVKIKGVEVTTKAHAFINHDVIGKPTKVKMILEGTKLQASGNPKAIRTTYNFGIGVNLSHKAIDYGIDYDVRLAEKYVGHQGSVKVRINF
ncbi:MAG: hypothetical protein Tsb006_4000 [Rickettsiaceae bacterium]